MPVLRPHGLRDDGFSIWSGEYELGVLLPTVVHEFEDPWLWSLTRAVIASGSEDGLEAAKTASAACWRGWLARLGMEEGATAFDDLPAGKLTMRPRPDFVIDPSGFLKAQHEVRLGAWCAGLISYWEMPATEPSYAWDCGHHFERQYWCGNTSTLEEAFACCDVGWRAWMALAGLRFVG